MGGFTIQIAASIDDARTMGPWPGTGGWNSTMSSHRIGYIAPDTWYMVGLRFASVPIPAGDIEIVGAVLRLRCAAWNPSWFVCNVHAEAADNAAVMSAGHTPYDAWLARGSAYDHHFEGYATWEEGNWYDISCKNALQEVIDRPGWVENNAVLFPVAPENSVAEGRDITTYDADPTYAAKLVVTYQVAQHWVSMSHDDPGGI